MPLLGEDAGSAAMTESPSKRRKTNRERYSTAQDLPFEIQQTCIVYFQEQLHSQALALLHNILVSSADAARHGRRSAALLPSPQILALSATLIVYPSLTTYLAPGEQVKAADEALSYLQHVNALVGSRNARFNEAFGFAGSSFSRSSRRRQAEDDTLNGPSIDNKLDIKLVGSESLWQRADDFWSVVGWAFNCSVKHPRRWARWRLWLDFMIQVLQDDLVQCEERSSYADSLLTTYLRDIGSGRTGKRKVMRAILADGSKSSMNEFGEVWRDETRERKEANVVKMTKRLDFEKEDFADYMDLDDDESDDQAEPGSAHQPTKAGAKRKLRTSDDNRSETSNDTPTRELARAKSEDELGGHESIVLRQRLFALLDLYCSRYAAGFLDNEDLYDLFTEFLRPLPLSTFILFVSPSTPYLSDHSQATLLYTLLRPLLSADAPIYNRNNLNQEDLIKHYLPFASNHVHAVDNAKVSILVEKLLRLLWLHGSLKASKSLRAAAERGIAARLANVDHDGRRKTKDNYALADEARTVLDASTARVRAVLDVLEGAEQEAREYIVIA